VLNLVTNYYPLVMVISGVEVNLLSVLVASVATFIVGSLWYSPFLFGNMWQKLVDISPKQLQGGMVQFMVGGFLVGAAIAFVFTFVLQMLALPMAFALQSNSAMVINLAIALFIGVGFIAIPAGYDAIYSKRSLKLLAIDKGYQIVSLLVIAVVVAILG
jgi:hypothetical protein